MIIALLLCTTLAQNRCIHLGHRIICCYAPGCPPPPELADNAVQYYLTREENIFLCMGAHVLNLRDAWVVGHLLQVKLHQVDTCRYSIFNCFFGYIFPSKIYSPPAPAPLSHRTRVYLQLPMLIPHHLNCPTSGNGYPRIYPPISGIGYRWQLPKHPLFLIFSGNIFETTANIYLLSRENGKAHVVPLCIRVGCPGFTLAFIICMNEYANCYVQYFTLFFFL